MFSLRQFILEVKNDPTKKVILYSTMSESQFNQSVNWYIKRYRSENNCKTVKWETVFPYVVEQLLNTGSFVTFEQMNTVIISKNPPLIAF